ncbi:MAG: hypothetical protein KC619_28045 [Myxococcales bacterium]|nr:hypothetical protein [Myxococcales bacterium]
MTALEVGAILAKLEVSAPISLQQGEGSLALDPVADNGEPLLRQTHHLEGVPGMSVEILITLAR